MYVLSESVFETVALGHLEAGTLFAGIRAKRDHGAAIHS